MEYKLSKQAQKYLIAVDAKTFARLTAALEEVSQFKGDIKKLAGKKNEYRYKIEHYRILFSVDRESEIIYVSQINTRTNINY